MLGYDGNAFNDSKYYPIMPVLRYFSEDRIPKSTNVEVQELQHSQTIAYQRHQQEEQTNWHAHKKLFGYTARATQLRQNKHNNMISNKTN